MSVKLNFKNGMVDMSMGAGGKASHLLVEQLMKKAFQNDYLNQGNDQAILPKAEGKIVLSTDSYVITPYFFPGGNIGSLAVSGTINDIAVSGATPLYLTVGLILEEGFLLNELKRIIYSMAETAKDAGVSIVTGDTKVVEKGKCDGIYINTSGVGILSERQQKMVTGDIQVGDKILINGSIADHGVAIMSKRQNLTFETKILSDAQPLNTLIAALIDAKISIRLMRDPTRGGISASLNEWANQYHYTFILDEASLPIKTPVLSACELLGLDPLFIANEGKILFVIADKDTNKAIEIMHKHPMGKDAAIIGKVSGQGKSHVSMQTAFGGLRRVDWLSGEQLPRIC